MILYSMILLLNSIWSETHSFSREILNVAEAQTTEHINESVTEFATKATFKRSGKNYGFQIRLSLVIFREIHVFVKMRDVFTVAVEHQRFG